MCSEIEIVDTHIVYNTIDNEPFKIIIIKYTYFPNNTRFNMLIRYNEFLWISVISQEQLEKIQKSNDITLNEPYIIDANGNFKMKVNIVDIEQHYIYKLNHNFSNIYNCMLTRLDLFEIDEQQYVLK